MTDEILDGKYEISDIKLGEGAYSTVKLCKSLTTNTKYAVKLFKSSTIPNNTDAVYAKWVKNTFQEIEIVKSLNHPNIAKIIDFNLTNGIIEKKKETKKVIIDTKYIVFEYIENGDLIEYVMGPNKHFPEPIAKKIFMEMLDALDFLSKNKISHRDLKLENMGLDSKFNLKFFDFGFAKVGNELLSSGIGTKEYMAPEIIENQVMHKPLQYYGQKVDIFAIGIIIFSLCLGIPPFKLALPDFDIKYKTLCKNPTEYWSFFSKKVSISNEFKDLINKMLAYDSNLRPTIEQIQAHPWLSTSIATLEEKLLEFKIRRSKLLLPIDRIIKTSKICITTTEGLVYRSPVIPGKKKYYPFYQQYAKNTSFYCKNNPELILNCIIEALSGAELSKLTTKEHSDKYKLTIFSDSIDIKIKLREASEGIVQVEMMQFSGSKLSFMNAFNLIMSSKALEKIEFL